VEIRKREIGRHTPIIAFTARVMKEDEERCLAVGMDAFLPKPLDIGKLSRVLAEWSGGPPGANDERVQQSQVESVNRA
jgi:CheY-like chemotaxis protein